jgi:hypothetical protein
MKFIKKLWNASIVAVFGILLFPLAYAHSVALELSVDVASSINDIGLALGKLIDKLLVEL